ncbi:hypothetical protein ACS8YF_19350, partial [Salinisphaera sp. SWV1]|uniref:hypothetical protein n=1 Tax=Salinisphaera sp. SWV1 TaxID=3454139 RepID=UPI003F82F9F0
MLIGANAASATKKYILNFHSSNDLRSIYSYEEILMAIKMVPLIAATNRSREFESLRAHQEKERLSQAGGPFLWLTTQFELPTHKQA